MKSFFRLQPLIFVALAFLSASVNAGSITTYQAKDTGPTGSDCDATQPHGLWTQNTPVNSGSCSPFFSMGSDAVLTVDKSGASQGDWFATLTGSASNSGGSLAIFDLTFSNFTDDHTLVLPKTGGGGDPSTWDFFRDLAGTITLDGVAKTLTNTKGNTSLQIGWGANDKTSAFGASAWIQGPNLGTDHWDLNLDLEVVPAPEPSTLILMLISLLGFQARKRIKAG